MTDFAIYPDVSLYGDESKNGIILFSTSDFSSIYSDRFIQLIWNAVRKQPIFKIKKNDGNWVTGGCTLLNSSVNSINSFRFENNNTTEYFFSTSKGTAPSSSEDDKFEFGDSFNQWNRSKIWLSSLFDDHFPYYDIDINTISSNGYLVVKKVVL